MRSGIELKSAAREFNPDKHYGFGTAAELPRELHVYTALLVWLLSLAIRCAPLIVGEVLGRAREAGWPM